MADNSTTYTPEACLRLARKMMTAQAGYIAARDAVVTAWETVKPVGGLGDYKTAMRYRANTTERAVRWAETLIREADDAGKQDGKRND